MKMNLQRPTLLIIEHSLVPIVSRKKFVNLHRRFNLQQKVLRRKRGGKEGQEYPGKQLTG